jgi:hypothetical protein
MFELKLTELLSTIGAGLIVIVISVYFYFLTQKLYNPRKHNSNGFFNWFTETLKIEFKQTGYAFVASFLIFAAGTLTEDITDHMADSEDSKNAFVTLVKNMKILKKEGELRKETLIKSDTALSGLGHEIFGNLHYFKDSAAIKRDIFFTTDNAGEYWKKNGAYILADSTREKKLISMINGLYYSAKNWCYLNSVPARDELKDVQNRIDFARSVCLISSVTLLVLIFFFVIYYIRELCKGNKRFKVFITQNQKTITRRLVFSPHRSIFLLILIFCISRMAYEVAEKNFNERAFGYYISHFKLNKLHKSSGIATP